MIPLQMVEDAMYQAMRKAATTLPPDVEQALEQALSEETDALARQHLQVSLDSARLAAQGHGLLCGDTGFPLYFVIAGSGTVVEGGFAALWYAAQRATARATENAFLRPTMVDPITRENPGDNLGPGMPKVELSFCGEGDALQIIAAPKGGGSEIFGTFYRMLYPADGLIGVKKFVIDCIRDGCYAGKICPPAIIGVGIGGTADLCMKLAKQAAVLRAVGTPNPRLDLVQLEGDLLQAARHMGIGPMGSRGTNAVMAMHVEVAATHTAALPVAVNAQCLVGRRWKATLQPDGQVEYSGAAAAPVTEDTHG